MSGLEMIKLYRSNGWYIDRIHGSHYVLKKDGRVQVIPVHSGKDLAKGLEKKLLKDLEN